MELSFDAFDSLCELFSMVGNPNPEYVPSLEEIESLSQMTQVIRPIRKCLRNNGRKGSGPTPRIGRPYRLEKDLTFIESGKEGEPLISQYDFYSFLIYLSETASPSPTNTTAKKNLSDLNQFLRENLTLI